MMEKTVLRIIDTGRHADASYELDDTGMIVDIDILDDNGTLDITNARFYMIVNGIVGSKADISPLYRLIFFSYLKSIDFSISNNNMNYKQHNNVTTESKEDNV